MPGKQVVTINMMHTCPMWTGLTPHVGGPVIGPGCPGVKINGQAVSLQGDMCQCQGPPDTIIEGCPGVLINGKPLVLQNCMTAHGGTIPMGVPGVTVSSNTSSVLSITKDREPAVYNLQWIREDSVIREYKVLKTITLTADTRNIPDGENTTLRITRQNPDNGEDSVVELTATVQNNRISVEWTVEDNNPEAESADEVCNNQTNNER